MRAHVAAHRVPLRLNLASGPFGKAVDEAIAAAKQVTADELADFAKAREAYLAAKVKDLAALDKKIVELTAASGDKSGAIKVTYDARLAKIREHRAQLALDIRAIDGTAAPAWDAMIKKLDKESRELATLVDQAPATLLVP